MPFQIVPIYTNTDPNLRESMAVYYADRMAGDLRQLMPECASLSQAQAALLDAGYPTAAVDAVVRRAHARAFGAPAD